MRKSNPRSWLPVFLAFAASMAALSEALAQPPAQVPSAAVQVQTPKPDAQLQQSPEQVGDLFMVHQRYQAAIEAFSKAPRDSASVWNKTGIAYQMMFNLQEAAKCYQASLKIDPRNATVVNNLGTVYDSLKQFGAAERAYRKALKLDPQSAIIEKNLGTNLLAQHKYKKGWEVYKAALALDPEVFERSAALRVENPNSALDRGAMNFYMAKGCVRAGKNGQAIEYLRMALNEGFTNPKRIVADSEFATLRGIPAFEQLLAAQHNP